MVPQPPTQLWLEQLPLPAGVIRAGRFTYVNDALAALTGYTREEMTGLEFFAPVAPEDRKRVRDRHIQRLHGELVTSSYEFDVVRTDGTRRRVEIWVQQAGPDTLFQLYDRTDAAEHERKLLALARLGASVQGQHARDGVLAALDTGAASLGLLALRAEPRRDGFAIVSLRLPDGPAEDAALDVVGRALAWSTPAREAWRDGIAYIDDLPMNAEAAFADGSAGGDLARRRGFVRAVFLRIDEGTTPAQLLVLSAPWMKAEDVPTLSLFGAQITAALTAARAIADLSKRNDELAALNRVATSAGTITESEDLFVNGSAALADVIACTAIGFYLLDPKAGDAVLAYMYGANGGAVAGERRVSLEGTWLRDVVREAKPRIAYHDPTAPARGCCGPDGAPFAAIVSVPLIARAEVIGVMNVAFAERERAEPRVVELLQAAAAHFAATIEASRLFGDLRRSYAELTRAQEQLVHRERLAALGEMAAAVAHEVRNPLGVIFNAVGSLRRLSKEDEGDITTLVSILAEEAARLNDIVGDLLDFARPVRPELHPASLADVVGDAVRSAVGSPESRVEVTMTIGVELPAVPLDTRLLRQAVLNIAQNAVQSMNGEGELRVRISSVQVDDRAHARVEIRDSGPGIPPDVLPRVFEPFFTTRPQGTGLGLAVVKRIVEGHGGRVSVTSEPGTATFVIDLPAQRDG